MLVLWLYIWEGSFRHSFKEHHIWNRVLLQRIYKLLNKKYYLYIVDYHSKYLVIKQVEGLITDNLIKTRKTYFPEYGVPSKIISYVSTYLVTEEFKKISR